MFAFVIDVANDPMWQSEVIESEWLDEGETRVERRQRRVFRFLTTVG